MIRHLNHSQINKEKWDACLDAATYTIIYARSWYLDVVSPQWEALVWGDYEIIFPLTWKKKAGQYYLSQPAFAQHLGIFSTQSVTSFVTEAFLRNIPKKFSHYNICLNPANPCTLGNWNKQLRKTYHLDLSFSYNQLVEGYSKDTIKNLKHSNRYSLHIKPIKGEQVIELYKKYVWHKTPELAETDFKRLLHLFEVMQQYSKVVFLGVYDNHQLSAGTAFYITSHKIIFIFGSSTPLGKRNGAMRVLFDHLICQYSNQPLILDFEGSSNSGVEYFYKSFGSSLKPFYKICYFESNWLQQLVTKKQELRRLWSGFNL